jgi:drug/metabolite transporter (DMT)-like permease
VEPLLAARLRLLAAAALFSTGPAAIKACGLTSWQVAGFRSGTAALALFLLLPAASRRRLGSPRLWLVSVAYAGTLVCYAVASKLTTAANAIFLQSAAPLYLLLLSPWLLGERVRRRDLLFLAAMLGGMALLLVGDDAPSAVATDPVRGNLLSIASGVFWALTLLGLRWLERGREAGQGLAAASVVAGNALAFAVTLPLALPLVRSTALDWGLIAYLGTVQIGLAYLLVTRAMGAVPAFEASLLLLLEPVLTPLWAWAAHGERPSAWALAGGGVMLVATVARTVLRAGDAGGAPPAKAPAA